MKRRALLSSIVGATTLAGCTFVDEDANEGDYSCHGDCEYIEQVTIDSESGFGDSTDIAVTLTEIVSEAHLVCKVYGGDHVSANSDDVIGVKSVMMEHTGGETIRFKDWKTDSLSDIEIEIDVVA